MLDTLLVELVEGPNHGTNFMIELEFQLKS
jgi:hypothetical protein